MKKLFILCCFFAVTLTIHADGWIDFQTRYRNPNPASTRKQRDGDYAIKLYFGVENEDVWDIAKRYSTDVNAVMEENEIAGEKLEKGGMLLIPIVS